MDYRIDVRVKNNRVLSALKEIGHTPTSFAREYGVEQNVMSQIIRMEATPYERNDFKKGLLRKEVIALCGATNKLPEELFTDAQATRSVKNKASTFVSEALLSAEKERLMLECRPSDEVYEEKEEIGRVKSIMEKVLDPRRLMVMNMRMDGRSLRDIGKELDITQERVRQLETDSVRKIQTALKL